MNAWLKKTTTLVGGGALLAGAFYAGTAFAAPDPLLAAADASTEKAIAQLKAAKNDGVKPPFGGHRAKAVWHLKRARKQIAKASKYVVRKEKKAAKKAEKAE